MIGKKILMWVGLAIAALGGVYLLEGILAGQGGGIFIGLIFVIVGIIIIKLTINKVGKEAETSLMKKYAKGEITKEQFDQKKDPEYYKQPVSNNPLDILKERYANGEITKEQFDQMKKDLES